MHDNFHEASYIYFGAIFARMNRVDNSTLPKNENMADSILTPQHTKIRGVRYPSNQITPRIVYPAVNRWVWV